jgi:hypothetical protein
MLSSILDPLLELYRGPSVVPLPLTRMEIADIFQVSFRDGASTVSAYDARRLLAWAPDGVLRLPAPDARPVAAVGAGGASIGMAFAAGCLAGASMISAPIYTAFAFILMATLIPGIRLPSFV